MVGQVDAMTRHICCRLAFMILLLPAFAACVSTPTARKTLAVGSSITLQPGEQVTLPGGGTLRYVGLAADSRCPEKTQCIWAGDADVLFTHMNKTIHLHTNAEPKSIRVDDHTLVLEAVTQSSAASATVRLNP